MSSKKIVLISVDGESFEIDEKVARKMVTISHMIDDDCVDAPIPLQNAVCTGKNLALVIEYGKNICDQDEKIAADSTEVEDHDLVEKPMEVDEKGKGKEVAEDHDDHVEKAKEVAEDHDDHVEKAKEVAEDHDHVEKAKGKEVAEDLDNAEKDKEDHVEENKGKEVTWDATDFINKLELSTIFEVILTANYLNFQSLLDLSCQAVADHIKDMQPEEVRKIFNIVNDFTPDEEAEIRKENAWAFEEPRTATADSETTEEGGVGDGSGTTKEGDSKTTEEDVSKTTEEGGSGTTKEGSSKTTEEGSSNTTEEDVSKTTEEVSKAQAE